MFQCVVSRWVKSTFCTEFAELEKEKVEKQYCNIRISKKICCKYIGDSTALTHPQYRKLQALARHNIYFIGIVRYTYLLAGAGGKQGKTKWTKKNCKRKSISCAFRIKKKKQKRRGKWKMRRLAGRLKRVCLEIYARRAATACKSHWRLSGLYLLQFSALMLPSSVNNMY